MSKQIMNAMDDAVQVRQQRRADLLLQRERAAEARRRRGFGLRLPASQPLVRVGSGRPRLG
jgi:hypothetical protein